MSSGNEPKFDLNENIFIDFFLACILIFQNLLLDKFSEHLTSESTHHFFTSEYKYLLCLIKISRSQYKYFYVVIFIVISYVVILIMHSILIIFLIIEI